MSNRTDFEALAAELVAMFHLDPNAENRVGDKLLWRIESELRNAFVAGQESDEAAHTLAALRPGVEVLAGLVFDHGHDRIAACTEIAYLEREETEPVRAVLAWLRASKEAGKAVGG